MKKPVAEVNIKIFSEKNGHYKADTFVSIDPGDIGATLAALEAQAIYQEKLSMKNQRNS